MIKRQRNSINITMAQRSLAPRETTKPAQKKQRPDTLSPEAYIRTLFVTAGCVISAPKAFSKPKEEDIAAYDLDVVRAIRSKNIEKLRELYTAGKNLNACNQFGESLLHMACRRGDIAIVKFMIREANVRVESRDDFGRNPFHDACWTSSPNFDVMDVLISKADPLMMLAADVRGSTPFDYARREHNKPWLGYLESRKDTILARLPPSALTQSLRVTI
jgi:ankyrin repeat protein